MRVVFGVDLGTTKITALALDVDRGDVLGGHTSPNDAEVTSADAKTRGHSEWEVRRIAAVACDCLRSVAGRVGPTRVAFVDVKTN